MSGNPILAGVIGSPIGHSRSPKLHGHWLDRYGIPGHYIAISVDPKNLADSLQALADLGFVGVNVTIPHKEAVLELATKVTTSARQIGAANTLTFDRDGNFVADNTDSYGFIANIAQKAPDWRADHGPALVIGAGGASRAIVHGLLSEGAPEIRVANRNPDRARNLAAHFGSRIVPVGWADIESATRDAATIVNTTSLGMSGQPPLVIPLENARPDAVITDIVYEPLVTPFLQSAQQNGFRIVDGLGMLLHQAAPGFEQWFGHKPEVDDLSRRAALAD